MLLFASLASTAQPNPQGGHTAAPPRVKVSESVSSAFISQKAALRYPQAAQTAGIQGPVVLKVVTNESGDVIEVEAISGDPALAQAAIDSVKQWKYKPYLLNGSPVQMESQLSINFRLKSAQSSPPSLGSFRDDVYVNDFFDLEYPLSRDWVRETDIMRARLATQGNSGMYVLLAAVHIPQHTAPLEADSFFSVYALHVENDTCTSYLRKVAEDLVSHKQAKQEGSMTELKFGPRTFDRVDFEFREKQASAHSSARKQRTFYCNGRLSASPRVRSSKRSKP